MSIEQACECVGSFRLGWLTEHLVDALAWVVLPADSSEYDPGPQGTTCKALIGKWTIQIRVIEVRYK